MGANATQAQGFALFLIGFVFVSAGLAADINFLYLLVGIALLAGSMVLFLKCKPCEHIED